MGLEHGSFCSALGAHGSGHWQIRVLTRRLFKENHAPISSWAFSGDRAVSVVPHGTHLLEAPVLVAAERLKAGEVGVKVFCAWVARYR